MSTKAGTMIQDDFRGKVLYVDESNQLDEEDDEMHSFKTPI
jgi:hypothetical protein